MLWAVTRVRWALVLTFYAVAAAVVFVFTGPGVPPCFGTVPTGQVTPECFAAWQVSLANRPLVARLFDTPWGAVVVFLVLVVVTWAVVRLYSWFASHHVAPNR